MATNYSEQPETSANGGDLGFVPESSLKSDRQAAEAISKLKTGQYTPPLPGIAANNRLVGFRIIRLLSRETAGQRQVGDPQVHDGIRPSCASGANNFCARPTTSQCAIAKMENYLADSILKGSGAQP